MNTSKVEGYIHRDMMSDKTVVIYVLVETLRSFGVCEHANLLAYKLMGVHHDISVNHELGSYE